MPRLGDKGYSFVVIRALQFQMHRLERWETCKRRRWRNPWYCFLSKRQVNRYCLHSLYLSWVQAPLGFLIQENCWKVFFGSPGQQLIGFVVANLQYQCGVQNYLLDGDAAIKMRKTRFKDTPPPKKVRMCFLYLTSVAFFFWNPKSWNWDTNKSNNWIGV